MTTSVKLFLYTALALLLVTSADLAQSAESHPKKSVDVGVSLYGCGTEELTDAEAITQIASLLKLKGNKTPFWGVAVSREVSQTFGPSPKEVIALFRISCLFYRDASFASAAVLVDKDANLNTTSSIDVAYARYRRWFQRIRKIGLAKARELKLDPLAGSSVSWY